MLIDFTITRTGSLPETARQQLPFALAQALNQTANDIQFAARIQLRQRFTVRRLQFVERLVKRERTDWARKDHLVARVGIQGRRADLLAKFERGGIKTPSGRSIAVPVAARRTKNDIVQQGQRPRAVIDSGKAFIDERGGGRFIFQRVGRGKTKSLRTLYVLKPRVRIPDRLDFLPEAEATARRRFLPNVQSALTRALATARVR